MFQLYPPPTALALGSWLPHFSPVENDPLCPSEQRVDKWHLMSLPAPIHLDGRLQTTTLCLIFCTPGAFFSDFFKAPLIFVPPSCGPQNVYSVIWRRKCFPAILFKRINQRLYHFSGLVAGNGSAGKGPALIDPLTRGLSEPTSFPCIQGNLASIVL